MKQDSNKEIKYKIEEYESGGLSFIKVTAEKMYFNVTLCDLGASIYELFFYQRRMTLTPKYISDFKRSDLYHGKTIGRINGRIKNAKITVDGIDYFLDKNDGENTLHGGRGGLSNKYFEYRILEDKETIRVLFHYESPHLDAGFPEKVDIYVTYIFLKRFDFPVFYIVFDGVPERDTPLKLTNHTYWCLGDPNVKTLSLKLYSDSYATYDENLLYTGVKKTNKYPFFDDEMLYYVMKEEFKDGIDNYFFLNKKHDKSRPCLLLENSHSGMAVYTNFDGIHLFTDNFEDGIEYFHTKSKKFRALAIEPSLSPNDPGIISKANPFHRYIIYEFYVPKD